MVSLWQFSLDLHACPGADADLIALQDQAGIDVPALIFCVYAGLSSPEPLGEALTVAARDLTQTASAEKIAPLRTMRRHLKKSALQDSRVAELREHVKRAELDAEKRLIEKLAAHMPMRSAGSASVARRNVETYVRAAALTLDAAHWQAVDRLIASASAVFVSRP